MLRQGIREMSKVGYWLIITLKLSSFTQAFYTLSKHTAQPVLLCCWIPFPSFLPYYFLFIVVFFSSFFFIDTLLLESSFLPSSPETAFSCDGVP